jgi:membrane protease YdiL (CAAX protease family)
LNVRRLGSLDLISIWRVVARVLLFIVACALVLAFVAPIAGMVPERMRVIFTGVAAGTVALVLTVLFTRWDGVSLGSVGAALTPRSPIKLAFGFFVGLVLVAVWAALSATASHFRWDRTPGSNSLDSALALLGYMALACREELAFRGYPLRRLEQRFNGATAQVSVAALFALEHRLGGTSWSDTLLGIFMGSLLFGAAALATRGLAVPIGLHSAWNFGQWTLGLKGAPGIWHATGVQVDDQRAYWTAMATYVVVILLATFAFTWWGNITDNRRRAGTPG